MDAGISGGVGFTGMGRRVKSGTKPLSPATTLLEAHESGCEQGKPGLIQATKKRNAWDLVRG